MRLGTVSTTFGGRFAPFRLGVKSGILNSYKQRAMTGTYLKKQIGIPKGVCATDKHARELDDGCKSCAQEVFASLTVKYGNSLTFKKKLDKSEIPGNVGACQPDGGLWYFENKLIAAFEAKKQGNGGNAIERWFKNNFICRMIAPKVSYVTFGIGPGACENGVIPKCLAVAHLNGLNELHPEANSLFLSKNGFTGDQIKAIMIQTIVTAVENYEG